MSTLPVAIRPTLKVLLQVHVSFDGVYLAKGLVFSKEQDMFVGPAGEFIDLNSDSILDQFDKEGMLVYLRSNTHSDFRFPIGIFALPKSSAETIQKSLQPLIEDLREKLLKYGGVLRATVCDGHASHRNVCN